MIVKTVVVGDTAYDLAEFASQYSTAHVDKTNIDVAVVSPDNYHVSLGDVDLHQLIRLLDTADQIVLQPKHTWSSQQLLLSSLYVCRSYSHRVPVTNLETYPQLFSYAESHSTTTKNNLWIFGGSLTKGQGLDDPHTQSVGRILGKLLGVDQIINTSEHGGGLRRSLEVLINCNLQPGDYVLLDPTLIERLRLYKNNQVVDCTLAECGRDLVMAMTDDQLFYDFVSRLDTFIKICNLAKTKLVFFSWQTDEGKILDCYNYFSQYPSWSLSATQTLTTPVDVSQDQYHPGPNTHAKLAQELYKHFKITT